MASRVETVVIDDLDGTDNAESIRFALDGVGYEMDLGPHNYRSLVEALAPFVRAARIEGGKARTRFGVVKGLPQGPKLKPAPPVQEELPEAPQEAPGASEKPSKKKPAAKDGEKRYPCDQPGCEWSAKAPQGLGTHRRTAHGIAGKAARQRRAEDDAA